MNTALVMKPDFLAPLRQLTAWLLPAAQRPRPSHGVPRPIETRIAPDFVANNQDSTWAKGQNPCKSKPLRVVRVMESGQPRSEVGRMVISGRMADVCAELDRLAACEAA